MDHCNLKIRTNYFLNIIQRYELGYANTQFDISFCYHLPIKEGPP